MRDNFTRPWTRPISDAEWAALWGESSADKPLDEYTNAPKPLTLIELAERDLEKALQELENEGGSHD